jgi:hypothetical protein
MVLQQYLVQELVVADQVLIPVLHDKLETAKQW